MDFSTAELTRYSRHFNLPNFSRAAQLKLKQAKVLLIGTGGLGSPMALYLTAAGVGHIGLIDADVVDLSNLQRQVLYTTKDIGQSKVEIAAQRLSALNPHVSFTTYNEYLSVDNAIDIISQYDIIADGTDNFPTRYLVNDACVLTGRVNVYASIFRYEGQVAVFNQVLQDGTRSANYRDLYPTPPPAGSVPDCAAGGILGVMAGVLGNLQALEVIKAITGIGDGLINQILLVDTLSMSFRKLKYSKKADTNITELVNYDEFCGVQSSEITTMAIKEITVQDLKEWRDSGKAHQLVDVREANEYEFANIDGDLIPLGSIMSAQDKIKDDVDVVLMCRSGQRSAAAVDALQKAGFDNLYNLKGGILAWSREIDNTIPQY